MATAVLCPQHCLPFPHHHPHDSSLLETISDREIRNPLSPPSPSSHPILFAPHPLRSSSSSEVHLCSRNNGVDIPSSSFSRASFSNSRSSSSSVRLPILRSSERMHLSTGRRPFRIVHGNTTPNTGSSNSNFNACLQKNGKKFPQVVARDALPSNNSSSLRLSNYGADLVSDIRKRAQFDSLPRRENQIVKSGGSRILANRIDVSTYADGIRSRSEGATASIPPVRILQRSKTNDTLLAESGWKTEEQLGFHKTMPQKKEAIPGFQQSQLSSKSFSDAFSWNYSSTSSQSRPMKEYSHNGEITGSRWQDPRRTPHTQRRNHNALPDQVDLAKNGTDSFSIHSKEDERWAGPGFSNSPPPSSLPLPKFSLKQQRSYSLRLLTPEGSCLDSTLLQDERKVASAPSSPPSQPAFFWRDLPKGEAGVDIVFATKDLRRILHLDY